MIPSGAGVSAEWDSYWLSGQYFLHYIILLLVKEAQVQGLLNLALET